MKNRRFIFLAISLLFFTLIISNISPVFAQQDQSTGSVGGKPANPREDNPRSKSIFVHEIKSGGTVKDAVNVINNTNQTKTIEVYPTDSQTSSGGTFACAQKADDNKKVGSWVKLKENSITLPANSSKIIDFTITVPKSATIGEHNGCIAIQAVEKPVSGVVNGANLSFRSAIRIVVTVSGKFTKDLQITKLEQKLTEIKVKTKTKKVIATKTVLKNEGNLSLDTNVITSVNSFIGSELQNNGGTYPILAGEEAEYNFNFNRPIWGGIYKITSKATYDNDLTKSLGEKGNTTKTISKTIWVAVPPSPLIGIIYLGATIAAIALLALQIVRMRRLRTIRNHSQVRVVSKGEDIVSIAKENDMNWKDLAKLNNLKKPYILNENDTINVPKKR